MSVNYLGYLAAALYIAAATSILLKQLNKTQNVLTSFLSKIFIYLAVICHGTSLYFSANSKVGANFSLFNTASIIALIITIIIMIGSRIKTVSTTALVAFPLSSIFIILSINYPLESNFSTDNIGIKIHIVLSLIAYSFFSVAIVQALFLFLTEYRLKTHRPIMNLLPPMRIIEELMFFSTTVAFILLTLGLAVGSMFIEDILDQNLAHKIFFSLLAWIIFLALIIGRFKYRLRGKNAILLVIGGFVLLGTGFFGTKLVLELIL